MGEVIIVGVTFIAGYAIGYMTGDLNAKGKQLHRDLEELGDDMRRLGRALHNDGSQRGDGD